jgi:membrane-bound lytic murein transglycosylase B
MRLRARLTVVAVLLTGGAMAGGAQEPAPPTAQTSFADFLVAVRAEARQKGISEATLDHALTGLEPEPVVIARDRAQPELTQSLDEYVAQRLTPKTLSTAQAMAVTHRELLGKIEETYGIPKPLMVAIWGLESNFGKFTGTYSTIHALATLAYDGRRALFRRELFDALTIVDRGQAVPGDLRGSWAGAMGQPQFMPSSFLQHAVDFDGDGKIDIWTSESDVFGSMASFLKSSGWTAGERWGREVVITKKAMAAIDRSVAMRTAGCRATREMTVTRPLAEWQRLGARLPKGAALPASSIKASLVRGKKRAFLVYANYEAILGYNCSNSYAVSVGLLADQIK